MTHTALVLITLTPPTQKQEDDQRKVATWLSGKNIAFKEIDAVLEKPVREELTTISGVRGNYPQIFITDNESSTTFIGCFDQILEMVELDGLDEQYLQNPEIKQKTLSYVFRDCISK